MSGIFQKMNRLFNLTQTMISRTLLAPSAPSLNSNLAPNFLKPFRGFLNQECQTSIKSSKLYFATIYCWKGKNHHTHI